MTKILVCLVLVASAFAAMFERQADLVITNDPLIPNSVQTGHYAYMYDGDLTKNSASKSHLVVTSGEDSYVEVLSQADGALYRFCADASNCDAETTSALVQPLHTAAFTMTQNIETVAGKQCTVYSRNVNDGIARVCFDAAGIPLRAVFANGMTWTLSNVVDNVDGIDFSIDSRCPKPSCSRVMDIIFNLDASSSIDNKEWVQYKAFVNKTINAFELGADKANVAIVRFQSSGAVMHTLTADGTAAFNTLDTWTKKGSGTCAGAGIEKAFTGVISQRTAKRAALNPATVIITVTDGADYTCSGVKSTADVMAKRGSSGVTFITLGIGNNLDDEGLQLAANNVAANVLKAADFNVLQDKINDLVAVTCSAMTMNLCGTTCNGFCTCNSKCVVPVCKEENCKVIEAETPEGGCIIRDLTCPSDSCYEGSCNLETGACVNTTTLTNADSCFDYTCDPAKGWMPSVKECRAPENCKVLVRNSENPECCEYEDADCAEITCKIGKCNVTSGECQYSDMTEEPYDKCDEVSCVDNKIYHSKKVCTGDNMCLNYYCDTETGGCTSDDMVFPGSAPDPCVEMICDPATGDWSPKPLPNCNACTLNKDACADTEKGDCDIVTCVPEDSKSFTCDVKKLSDDACASKVCDLCMTPTVREGTCEETYCDVGADEPGCKTRRKEGCDACTLFPCEDVKCQFLKGCEVVNNEGTVFTKDDRTCTYSVEGDEDWKCAGTDGCKVYGCNSVTGSCTVDDAVYSGSLDKCHTPVCRNGKWDLEEVVCETNDPCKVASCDPAVGCVISPLCTETSSKCSVPVCHEGVCGEESLCNTGDHCDIGTCNEEKGTCDFSKYECEPKNCKVAKCVSGESGPECKYEDLVCEQHPCYPAQCDAESGLCVNTTKCVETDFCFLSICAGEGACLTPPKQSPYEVPAEKAGCFEYVCYSQEKEWRLEPIDRAFLDPCGECMQNFDHLYDGSADTTVCIAGMTATDFGTSIGAVAIAGIVVAAVVGAALVATSGFFGTKELMRLASTNAAAGMQTNPLYEEDGVQVDNPMFEGTA